MSQAGVRLQVRQQHLAVAVSVCRGRCVDVQVFGSFVKPQGWARGQFTVGKVDYGVQSSNKLLLIILSSNLIYMLCKGTFFNTVFCTSCPPQFHITVCGLSALEVSSMLLSAPYHPCCSSGSCSATEVFCTCCVVILCVGLPLCIHCVRVHCTVLCYCYLTTSLCKG